MVVIIVAHGCDLGCTWLRSWLHMVDMVAIMVTQSVSHLELHIVSRTQHKDKICEICGKVESNTWIRHWLRNHPRR